MEALSHLFDGFAVAFRPLNLAMAFAGVLTGTSVGMLPGIGPINAIAILLPLTLSLGLPPESVLILMAGIYYGSQYGNSIAAILLNVPGTASATVTAIDGFAMTRKGEARLALASSAIASFIGGTLSIVGLMLLTPALSRLALSFGPAEYFALMVFAFTTLSSLSTGNVTKGLVSTVFGLMLATVGFDPNSAVPRFNFGQLRLLDGIDFVVVTIGVFAISEVLLALESSPVARASSASVSGVLGAVRDALSPIGTMLRGSVIGFLVGVLPGAGGTVASFVAYTTEKRFAKDSERMGRGDVRGVAAPEAANNAAATGAMIPLLTLACQGARRRRYCSAHCSHSTSRPAPCSSGTIPTSSGASWLRCASATSSF